MYTLIVHTGIKYFTEVFLNVLPFNWARTKLKKNKSPKMSFGALWFFPGPLYDVSRDTALNWIAAVSLTPIWPMAQIDLVTVRS